MKKFKFTIRGNTYEVEINEVENNIAEIEVNGTNFQVEIHKEVKKTKTPTLIRSKVPVDKVKSTIQKSSGGYQAKAPLPGTIIKVNVKEGDAVKKGDVLLIMEAMKMENNVMAEKDGTVKSIKVAAGEAVLQNDILIEIG